MSVTMTESTGTPAVSAQAPGERGETDELLGMAEAGRTPASVAWSPIEPSRMAARKAAFSASPAWRKYVSTAQACSVFHLKRAPSGFPAELCGQLDRLPEVSPVVLLDDGLGIRVADVDVGVGQEPDLAGNDRLDRELAAADRAVVEGHFDGDALLFVDGGQRNSRAL